MPIYGIIKLIFEGVTIHDLSELRQHQRNRNNGARFWAHTEARLPLGNRARIPDNLHMWPVALNWEKQEQDQLPASQGSHLSELW